MSGNGSMGEEKARGLSLKPLRWFLQFAGWVSEGKKKEIWDKNCHWESIKEMARRSREEGTDRRGLRLPGCGFMLSKVVQLQRASQDMVMFLLTVIYATSYAILSFPFSFK